MRPLMLELFSGTATIAAAFRAAGWETVTVDIEPPADHVQDVRTFRVEQLPRTPDFVWASPPCDEFTASRLPWHPKFGATPSVELVNEARRIIIQSGTPFWCIENTKGAVDHLSPMLGTPDCIGPVRLWHNLPFPIEARAVYWKTRLGGAHKRARASMPLPLTRGVVRAVTDAVFPPLFTPRARITTPDG